MERQLVIENHNGQVVRTFRLDTERAVVISRKDTRRIELHPDTAWLESHGIGFSRLGEISIDELNEKPFALGTQGHLKVLPAITSTIRDEVAPTESSRVAWVVFALLLVSQIGVIALLKNRPVESVKREEELKRHVVQIIKRNPPKPIVPSQSVVRPTIAKAANEPPQVKPTRKTAAIKRMGALAVLGSLSKSKQKGGLDLGAVNTTAGPGLGGTQGSGGTQTSLYGKGLVAAPVGAGNNLQGGGGYGTKGTGGGQAGYGKLSLVGSAGSHTIPLGREAIIQGGLDKDLIAEVVRRNSGQIMFCYEQGLQGDPKLGGRVAVNWTIGGNGQVKAAHIGNTTLNSKMVEDCILMRLKSWKFPVPDGGVDVNVSYPFMLKRAGQG